MAEEDSVEFRENLNRLNGECAGKLDTADNVAELTQELRQDLEVLRLRTFLDPKKHYKVCPRPNPLWSTAHRLQG